MMAAEALCPPLVAWAKRCVLETLNEPAPRSELHAPILKDGPRAKVHGELQDRLTRTVDGIENVSTLLVGPRGVGKHRLLSSVLSQIEEADVEGGGFLRVDLHPLLVPDEPTALIAIAAQLRVMHSSLSAKGSFCDALRYLLHLLRRARPAGAGEEASEGQSQPVIFVLHSFEEFTLRPKQTLLYSLFDLMQTDDAQMAVIGLTTRVDVADLLEKRVRSRCSQRQLWLPALDTTADCARLLAAALTLPDLGDASPVSGVEPLKAARFKAAWDAQTASVCAQLGHSKTLGKRLSCGVTPQLLQTALRLIMAELTTSRPDKAFISLESLELSLRSLMVPKAELTLCECAAVELILLLCLKKLSDKELPPPHTLRMALREYAVFVSSGAAQYHYPRALLIKSFEHLCALGLVHTARESRGRVVPIEEVPARLGTDAQTLHEFVKTHTELPLEVRRFGTQYTL
jgi:origin recognition complex subunit 4